MKNLLNYLLTALKEPSTYRGLAMFAIALGAPEGTLDQFVKYGFMVIGFLGLFPDRLIKDFIDGKKIDTKAAVAEIVKENIDKLVKPETVVVSKDVTAENDPA